MRIKKRKRAISIWLMGTDEHARFVLSAKRKRGGYFRMTGFPGGIETKWDYYPLKPLEHPGFEFIGYL